MKRRRTILALVALLIMTHLLRELFPDSWALGFWALLVDVLILLVILAEWLVPLWLRHHRDSIDEEVLTALSNADHQMKLEEIVRVVNKRESQVSASLKRLRTRHDAGVDYQGYWHKVSY